MKRLKFLFTAVFLFEFLGAPCFASTPVSSAPSIESQKRPKKTLVGVESETSYLQSSTSGLTGTGMRLSGKYALDQKFGFEIGVGSARSLSGSLAALYTNINLHAVYALWGGLTATDSSYSFKGEEFLRVKQKPRAGVLLTAGFDQYFFNASASVVSASGVGAALSYLVPYKNLLFSLGARSSYLALRSNKLISIGGVLGLSWPI